MTDVGPTVDSQTPHTCFSPADQLRTQSGGKEDEKNDGGQNCGVTVGLSVSAMLLVVFVAGFVLYRNRRGRPLPNNPMI